MCVITSSDFGISMIPKAAIRYFFLSMRFVACAIRCISARLSIATRPSPNGLIIADGMLLYLSSANGRRLSSQGCNGGMGRLKCPRILEDHNDHEQGTPGYSRMSKMQGGYPSQSDARRACL